MPFLSELLTEELTQSHVTNGGDHDDAAALAPLPRLLASLGADLFAESVQEEVDWLLERDAVLTLTARRRLLKAVDTALAVREHVRTPFTELERELQDQLPDEGVEGWAEGQELLVAVRRLARGELRPAEFPVGWTERVMFELGLESPVVFVYVDRAIGEAIRSEPAHVLEHAPLRGPQDPADLAEYDLLREQLREAILRQTPGGADGD
jgi:hypothetical protein